MAQVSKICNGAQHTYVFSGYTKTHKPRSVFSISLRSPNKGGSSSWGLRYNERLGNDKVCTVRVSASVGTSEKPSKVSEIVLQPIKEISGTVTLPGSKSLSNRILLLAALSEVCGFFFLVLLLFSYVCLILEKMLEKEMNLQSELQFFFCCYFSLFLTLTKDSNFSIIIILHFNRIQ